MSDSDDVRQGPEYGEDGLFRIGPQRARPITVRLIAETVGAPAAPAPHIARIQQAARKADRRRILARHARLAAAVRGEPIGRNRKGRAA